MPTPNTSETMLCHQDDFRPATARTQRGGYGLHNSPLSQWLLIAAAVLGVPPLLSLMANGLFRSNVPVGLPLMRLAASLSPFSSQTTTSTQFGMTTVIHQNLLTPVLLAGLCIGLSVLIKRFGQSGLAST